MHKQISWNNKENDGVEYIIRPEKPFRWSSRRKVCFQVINGKKHIHEENTSGNNRVDFSFESIGSDGVAHGDVAFSSVGIATTTAASAVAPLRPSVDHVCTSYRGLCSVQIPTGHRRTFCLKPCTGSGWQVVFNGKLSLKATFEIFGSFVCHLYIHSMYLPIFYLF